MIMTIKKNQASTELEPVAIPDTGRVLPPAEQRSHMLGARQISLLGSRSIYCTCYHPQDKYDLFHILFVY